MQNSCSSSFRVRSDIRAGVINISEDYFLTCFYPKGQGNPNNVELNFLRSGLLLKVLGFIICCALPDNSLDILCYLHLTHVIRML